MDKKSGFQIVIKDCMDVKKEETILILTDDKKLKIGQGLFEEAKKHAKEAVLMVMESRSVSGEEPPKCVAESMKDFDVIIAPTSTSITHTHAKINAIKGGARLASMPGITSEMFEVGAITADYGEVEELTLKFTELLTNAERAKLEKGGHVLTFDLKGRKGIPSTGVYRNKGEAGNLPSGEAYIAPLENGVNGTMIIDGSMVGIGKLDSPLKVEIIDGVLNSIEGDIENKLKVLFNTKENSTIAELGIGTNKSAKLTGVILEDEKIYGTVHIAFGTNTSFGGNNKAGVHMDGIILNPTLYLDEKLVIDKGVVKI